MSKRAFTLIETLAATVVLAISATVCARFISVARRSLELPRRVVMPLARAANAFMDDPDSFGVERSVLLEESFTGIEILVPHLLDPVQITIKEPVITDPGRSKLNHAYLMFQSGDLTVVRFIELTDGES